MNYVAGMLLLVMGGNEEYAFWLFDALVKLLPKARYCGGWVCVKHIVHIMPTMLRVSTMKICLAFRPNAPHLLLFSRKQQLDAYAVHRDLNYFM